MADNNEQCKCGSTWVTVCPHCHEYTQTWAWISVKDQLPPLSTWVLGLTQAQGIYTVRRPGKTQDKGYLRTDWILPWYMNEFMPITHWMPLPLCPIEPKEANNGMD